MKRCCMFWFFQKTLIIQNWQLGWMELKLTFLSFLGDLLIRFSLVFALCWSSKITQKSCTLNGFCIFSQPPCQIELTKQPLHLLLKISFIASEFYNEHKKLWTLRVTKYSNLLNLVRMTSQISVVLIYILIKKPRLTAPHFYNSKLLGNRGTIIAHQISRLIRPKSDLLVFWFNAAKISEFFVL